MSIEALNIKKTFGSFVALNNVSISVPEGKLVALLGPSGSGKTTLLRILAGLEFSDEDCKGKVLFHGEDVTNTPPGKRGVGMVFQQYALFRHMNVYENIAFGLKVSKNRPSHKDIDERVNELLHLVQLESFGKRFPSQLSGGQRQRIALARALAVKPKVLLLDEPFGALDAKVRKDLRRWLRTFHDSINLTTIFVTHDQEEALELADEVVIMDHGTVEQIGTPEAVYNDPKNAFILEFLGNVNRLSKEAVTELCPEITTGIECQVYARPHNIHLSTPRDPSNSNGKILHINAAGPTVQVSLLVKKTGEILNAEVSKDILREPGFRNGKDTNICILKTRIFPINRG